ncbi:hypothetical protein [Gloeocapsa sp. PCC 73106]|uniref:hypothetical protein n=1 Tax=Gloeocapsa sp. PCC 73106 TaxID=102232 RepID=UPI0002AC0DE3|nr:hypothetical protein [Gloeocapsa sp. PCC 73106]ELR97433.1 hypothetical protein GLO73106DRAFT_00012430 [Gloeocapsa sp. PCC 73106]
MNKKLISICLIAGVGFSLLPQLADAGLQSGKRYNRASNSPDPGFGYSLFPVPDTNSDESRGLFENAISNSVAFDESFSFGFNVEMSIPEADLLSSLNEGIVTYTFRAFESNIGTLTFPDTNAEVNIRTPLGGAFYTFSVDISQETPETQSQYINDIEFILDNDIFAQSVTVAANETLTVARVDDPSVTYELNTGGAADAQTCFNDGRKIFVPADEANPLIGICFKDMEREVEEPIPETNVLSGLAGLVMMGLFKIRQRKRY